MARHMNQYLLLIHGNETSASTEAEWGAFFARAKASGFFSGGSEVGAKVMLGAAGPTSDHIAGYMRFDCDDRTALLELLKLHPVVLHGGSIELCDLPRS